MQYRTCKIILGYNKKKLRTAKFIDLLLNRLFKGSKKSKSCEFYPKRILIIQSHLIGDVIMVTPMLKAVKRAYPQSKIFLLANEFAKDLLEGLPYVERIITMRFPWSMYDYRLKNLLLVLKTIKELRKEGFDLAIDAQIDMRNIFLMYLIGAKRRLGYDITGGKVFLTDIPEFPENVVNLLDARLSLLNYLGINTYEKTSELPKSQESMEWVNSYLERYQLNKEKIVAIHPGASKKEKLWQPEKFAKVIEYLTFKGYQPVVIEGPNDAEIVSSIIGMSSVTVPIVKTSLKNVVAFISCCRLIICCDSAAIHIAGAVGTPVVALYGPKWPELTKPFNDNIEVLWADDFDCRPCEYGHCKHVDHSCMDAIAVDAVITKVNKILNMSNEV